MEQPNNSADAGGVSATFDDEAPTTPKLTAIKTPRPRGFAAMDRKLVSQIASKGGKAAHAHGTAHEFSSDEARAAGRLGGLATNAKRRAKLAAKKDEVA